MKNLKSRVLLCAVVFFLSCENKLAFSDVITLKSGKRITGSIVEKNDDYIKVDSGIGITLTYYKDQIASVTSDEKPTLPSSNKIEVKDFKRERLTISEFLKLKDLFEHRQFSELEQMLNEYQKIAESNPLKEDKIFDAMNGVFASTLEEYQDLLTQWLKQSPSSFAAHLAQAQYYEALGWKSRGGKWASLTTDLQMQGMHQYFAKALDEIQKVLDINPKVLPAHSLRIHIYSAISDDRQEEATQLALDIVPESYRIRANIIQNLRPRWGGSYDLMEEFAKDSESYLDKNPNLRTLLGYIYVDQADMMFSRSVTSQQRLNTAIKNAIPALTPFIDKYEDAASSGQKESDQDRTTKINKEIEYYNRAIALGDNPYFYQLRGEAYWFLDNYPAAISDLKRAAELFPIDPSNYITLAKCVTQLNDYSESLRYTNIAESLDPNSKELMDWKNWASTNLIYYGSLDFNKQDYNNAINKFELALDFDAKNPQAYYWRGHVYLSRNQDDLAIADFKQSIQLKKDLGDAYYAIGYIYGKRNLLQESLDILNQGLAIDPNNPKLILERGHTYHLMGKEKEAEIAAKRACELGDPRACQIAREFK